MPQFRTKGKGKDRKIYPITAGIREKKLVTTRLISPQVEAEKPKEKEEAEPPVWLLIICGDSGGQDFEFFDSREAAEEKEQKLSKGHPYTVTRILDNASTNRYVKVLDNKNLEKLKRAKHEFKVEH